MADEVERVRERLEAIVEELADLAMDRLRQAVDEDAGGEAAAEERRLTRARRAVQKAVAVLDVRGPLD